MHSRTWLRRCELKSVSYKLSLGWEVKTEIPGKMKRERVSSPVGLKVTPRWKFI
jgi:hypothetical protein